MASFSPNMHLRLARQLLGDTIDVANTTPSPVNSPFIEYQPSSAMLLSKVLPEEEVKNLKTSTLSCSSRTQTDATPQMAPLDLFNELSSQVLFDDNDARVAYNVACQMNPLQALQAFEEEKQLTDSEILELLITKTPQLIQQLAIHPQGNFAFQKLYGGADETKQIQAIRLLDFMELGSSQHGTRSVQKIILSTAFTEEIIISLIQEKLAGHCVELILNQHGNHCIQKVIDQFQPQQYQYVVEECLQRILQISCHQLGCCVLQRLLEHCSDAQYSQLFEELNKYILKLVTDQFGNYVFQFILNSSRTTSAGVQGMIQQLLGHEIELCQMKASSHVIERCIGRAGKELRNQLIENLLLDEGSFVRLCCDRFANYVIQKAIQLSEGELLGRLMQIISKNQARLGQSQYAKHILQFQRGYQ